MYTHSERGREHECPSSVGGGRGGGSGEDKQTGQKHRRNGGIANTTTSG